MGVKAADGQFFASPPHDHAEFARFVACDRVQASGIDHHATVNLPKGLCIKLGQQVFEWRANKVFMGG
jgi:hypothetical protein